MRLIFDFASSGFGFFIHLWTITTATRDAIAMSIHILSLQFRFLSSSATERDSALSTSRQRKKNSEPQPSSVCAWHQRSSQHRDGRMEGHCSSGQISTTTAVRSSGSSWNSSRSHDSEICAFTSCYQQRARTQLYAKLHFGSFLNFFWPAGFREFAQPFNRIRPSTAKLLPQDSVLCCKW